MNLYIIMLNITILFILLIVLNRVNMLNKLVKENNKRINQLVDYMKSVNNK